MTRQFIWPFKDFIHSLDIDIERYCQLYKKDIKPCNNIWEHVTQVQQKENKSKEEVWRLYGLENDAIFLGTLIVVEENGSFSIPLKYRERVARWRIASHHLRHVSGYNTLVKHNLKIGERMKVGDNKEKPYLILRVAIRPYSALVHSKKSLSFSRGHANCLIIHVPSRRLFYIDPLIHSSVKPITQQVLEWLAYQLDCRQKWTFLSNVWFHKHFKVCPQSCNVMCRIWTWIMVITTVHNKVETFSHFLSVLNILCTQRKEILKLFLIFHILNVAATSCTNRCGNFRWLETLESNLWNATLECPIIEMKHHSHLIEEVATIFPNIFLSIPI